MKKMRILAIILVLALALTACGSKNVPEETTVPATTAAAVTETAAPAEPLSLTDWAMSANTWSSPNGATINISASPNYYEEGQKADFVVRLESDDVAVVPCQWDGSCYTASVDLNAANGYCYYVVLTAADGTVTEVAVNTPAASVNEALINMEASLASYCSVTIEESNIADNKLILTNCKVQVQTPIITNEGETIGCQEASLVLDCNGQLLNTPVSGLTATETAGLYEADLSGTTFDLPEMEADQSIELSVNVTLTNGQNLTAYGSSWVYNEGSALPVVG
jgi:hypothetical protein